MTWLPFLATGVLLLICLGVICFVVRLPFEATPPRPVSFANELNGCVDRALGIVQLPPIRITIEQYRVLLARAAKNGQIVQAEVRDLIAAGLEGS